MNHSEEATRILESEAYQLAVANARERIKADWSRCKASIEQREALWHAYQMVDSVTRELRVLTETRRMEKLHG